LCDNHFDRKKGALKSHSTAYSVAALSCLDRRSRPRIGSFPPQWGVNRPNLEDSTGERHTAHIRDPASRFGHSGRTDEKWCEEVTGMAGLRLRWDRIGLLAFTLLAALAATVWAASANADDGQSHTSSLRTAKASTTSSSAPTRTRAAATTAAITRAAVAVPQSSVSKAGPSGCPAVAGPAVRSAPGAGRTVALTFDDGPSTFTPQVLRILAEKHVPATFFMIGSQTAADSATVKAVAAQGHLIGNHTWSHRAPSASAGWNPQTLTTELSRTNTALTHLTGGGTCWFRPPEGIVKGTEAVAKGHGLAVALWSVDTDDWKVERGSTKDEDAALSRRIALNAVAGAAQEHPVVLMHDGGGYRGATVAALPSIIDFYRASGYTFVRLDGR
jgi:peptidoglycan/xylan/chitin deacetylase (PgdA/CDA1 family)